MTERSNLRAMVVVEQPELLQAISAWSSQEEFCVETLAVTATSSEPITLLNRETFHLVVVEVLDSTALAFKLLKTVRDCAGREKVLVLLPEALKAEAIALFRSGAQEVLTTEETSRDRLEAALAAQLKAIYREAQSDHLYAAIQSETTEFILTSKDLGSGLIPLDIARKLQRCALIDRATFSRIAVAFQEALTNSHLHGNLELDSAWKEEFDDEGIDKFSLKKDERLADKEFGERSLQVKIHYDSEKLEIRIRDEGRGFPVELRHRAPSPEDSILLTGRGLALMRWGMDEVSFNEKGNEVLLVKRLG